MENLFIGIQTQDLPTISTAVISGASINVGAIEGYFERGAVDGVHEFTNPDLLAGRLGGFKPSYYGMYAAQTFFENLQGAQGKLLIQRLNRTGSAVASGTINDVQTPTPVAAITIKAGQLGKDDPGAWGNRLGYLVLESSRGGSTVGAAGASPDNFLELDSVAPFAVHDWVEIATTPTPIYKKIEEIDESLNRIIFGSTLGAVVAQDLEVTVVDRTLRIYYKDPATGLLAVVETLSNWSIEPLSPYYFANRINDRFIGSGFVKVVDDIIASPRTILSFPAGQTDDEANVIFLTGGLEGSALTESQIKAQRTFWRDAKPIYVTNAEHFTEAVWDDAELYCYNGGKGDLIWIGSPTKDQTYAQLKNWALRRQKSRRMAALNNFVWINVDDPNGTPIQPRKDIPNVGAIMAHWIYVSVQRGIHKVPAGRFEVLAGIRGLVGEITDRANLRDLADIGLNGMSNDNNTFYIRSARTPSKKPEWRFANALLMQTFFKRSFEGSLQDLENETQSVNLFGRIRNAMRDFAEVIFRESTNGGEESGFASYTKPGGAASGFNDVVKIVVDETINSQEQLNNGIVKANFSFMPPKPAERMLVSVGLIYTIA